MHDSVTICIRRVCGVEMHFSDCLFYFRMDILEWEDLLPRIPVVWGKYHGMTSSSHIRRYRAYGVIMRFKHVSSRMKFVFRFVFVVTERSAIIDRFIFSYDN